MIRVKVEDRDGTVHDLDVPIDMNLNLMDVCKAAGLDVEGICGGIALCASCHCYVETDHELPERSEDEETMLDEAFFVDEEQSRLACQIAISDKLDGLKIKLAPIG